MTRARLPGPVWLLGWVSLATDSATEAIYPLLPFFLTQILHAGAVSLGIVEGVAEAVNSLLKIIAGRMADRSPRKRRLVLFGYTVSSLARPFIAIATSWVQVFVVRVFDRVGKGVRSAPRDAMLATFTTPTTRGKVYGFHRGMDHLGAVVGPALATLFLYFYPDRYRTLFALTIIPGAIAVALIFLVKEYDHEARPAEARDDDDERRRIRLDEAGLNSTGRSRMPREFTTFMAVLTLFMLGSSSDAFLLLKMTDVAGGPRFVPLMWAALHVVKASVSMVGGSWSDRVGRRAVIAVGWLVYAAVYAGFALSDSLTALVVWLLIYGFYFGLAEGTEKALVADLSPEARRGFAFGVYNAVQGIGSLLASVVFGVVWKFYGAPAAFGLGAALAIVATVLLCVFVRSPATSEQSI